MRNPRPTGLVGFVVVWLGQAVSLLGSGMSWFAFTVWAWQQTGQATALALVGFFSFAPTVLLSPITGVLVDRWNRKRVMMFSDMATALATVAALLLYSTGGLRVWHLCGLGAFAGTFQAFQYPAYTAAVTTMLPKEHYGRAEAVIGLAQSLSAVLAPILGSVLLAVIGFVGIMTIDVITFVVALSALACVAIPQPPISQAGREARGSLPKESLYGFRYLARHPGLLGLQLVSAGSSMVDSAGYALLAPMILARTGDNAASLGSVQSTGAVGAVVGGLLMAIWGGPKRRVHGVLAGWALAGLLGMSLLGLGRGVAAWMIAGFLYAFFTPIINGSEQAIWQCKVAPDVQGRVFGVQNMIAQLAASLGMLVAGPLADRVFEPAMAPGGSLALSFSWLLGTGVGAGMALMLLIFGLLEILLGLSGYLFHSIRKIEDLLPDQNVQWGAEVVAWP